MESNTGMRDVLIAVVLFIVAFLPRLIRLFDLDVWFDEVVLLLTAQHSYTEIWNLIKSDNYPPLYPWLLRFWGTLFPSENSLRIFAALTGSLTAPAAYFLGKEMVNRKLGILLGIACVLSYSLVYYSQMIRMYSLFPFWAILSLVGFYRGLKTNAWRYWVLTAAANLLGFYTFLFMVFLIAAQFLSVVWYERSFGRRFQRLLIVHSPVFILMLFWIIPLVQRFMAIEESFILLPVVPGDLAKLWVFLGTGTYFSDRYALAALLNLPFMLGFLIAVKKLWWNFNVRSGIFILIFAVVSVYLISLAGQSIFLKRYFIFLLPFYLGIVIAGWLALGKPLWRQLGLTVTFAVMLVSLSYYYVNYYAEHEAYGFCKVSPETGKADGHAVRKMSELIEKRIKDGEVIIHFSNPSFRNLSFFPSIYYHQRSLPEYFYSKTGLHHWSGGQFLLPGEHIESLQDLQPPPAGIWLVTLDPAKNLFDEDVISGLNDRFRWVVADNLPKELLQAGYRRERTYQYGNVSAVYLRRNKAQVQ
jgi:hypothetical protein